MICANLKLKSVIYTKQGLRIEKDNVNAAKIHGGLAVRRDSIVRNCAGRK